MYKKHMYYEDDDIKITIEDYNVQLYVHITVEKFTKAVYKKLKELCTGLAHEAWMDGYNEIFSYTSNKKFLKLFPGSSFIKDISYEGTDYGVYKWDLK